MTAKVTRSSPFSHQNLETYLNGLDSHIREGSKETVVYPYIRKHNHSKEKM